MGCPERSPAAQHDPAGGQPAHSTAERGGEAVRARVLVVWTGCGLHVCAPQRRLAAVLLRRAGGQDTMGEGEEPVDVQGLWLRLPKPKRAGCTSEAASTFRG